VYSFFTYLFQPYVLVLLLLVLATVCLWRGRAGQPRRLRWLILLLVVLTLLSTPAVGCLALGSLEWQYPPLESLPDDVKAIVVLGGGVVNSGRADEQLDGASIYRCLHAAKLYHQKPQMVLVSGGKPDPDAPGQACADLMADFLAQLNVPRKDLIVENVSRTTYENALESRKILNERHIDRVVLVTEAMHLHRAVLCFQKQGIDVAPSGCHYRTLGFNGSLYDFLPSTDGLAGCETASHEWVGILWYWLTRKT
jgi:uncharacterized SAM-binding protein YcdF (DUF218 family)